MIFAVATLSVNWKFRGGEAKQDEHLFKSDEYFRTEGQDI